MGRQQRGERWPTASNLKRPQAGRAVVRGQAAMLRRCLPGWGHRRYRVLTRRTLAVQVSMEPLVSTARTVPSVRFKFRTQARRK